MENNPAMFQTTNQLWIKSNTPINRHIFPSHAALQSSPAGAGAATGAATAATATAARGGDGGAGGGGGISWKGMGTMWLSTGGCS